MEVDIDVNIYDNEQNNGQTTAASPTPRRIFHKEAGLITDKRGEKHCSCMISCFMIFARHASTH